MKHYILFTLFGFWSSVAIAQSDTVHWRKGIKLSWEDFKAEDPNYKSNSWKLSQWKTKWNIDDDDVLSPRMQVIVYVNRATSWVNEEAKSEENLERIQNRFDLFELGARKSRMRLDSIKKVGGSYTEEEANGIIQRCFDWYDLQSSRMNDDYYYRSKPNYRTYWTTRIDSFFEIWAPYNKYVLIDKSKVGYDYDVVLGLGNWTNQNENLNNAFGFNLATHFGLIHNNWLYGTRLSLTTNRVTPEFMHRMDFALDETGHVNNNEFSLYVGHNLITTNGFRSFLLLAGGRSSVTGTNDFIKGTWSYTTSLGFDFVLNKDKTEGYEASPNRFTNFAVRARVDYNIAAYTDFYKPRILMLTLGFSIYGYTPKYARAGSIKLSETK